MHSVVAPKVSVIIPTHNPRPDYFDRVLSALKNQSMAPEEWELLIVDNHSDEPLTGRLRLSWCPHFRIVEEKILGTARARLRGIAEAAAELFVFVDDDNVLDPGYLEHCVRIGAEWPQLGTWGGSIVPEFEIPPSRHLVPHLPKLSLREVTSPRWTNLRFCPDAEPWGAGLCVRRKVALAYREDFLNSSFQISGRIGNRYMLSGEDTEICFVASRLGLGMGLFPELKLLHLISQRRLTDDYILRITHGLSATHLLLMYKWSNVVPKSPRSFVEVVRFLKHFASMSRFERRLAWADYHALVTAHEVIAANRLQRKAS